MPLKFLSGAAPATLGPYHVQSLWKLILPFLPTASVVPTSAGQTQKKQLRLLIRLSTAATLGVIPIQVMVLHQVSKCFATELVLMLMWILQHVSPKRLSHNILNNIFANLTVDGRLIGEALINCGKELS